MARTRGGAGGPPTALAPGRGREPSTSSVRGRVPPTASARRRRVAATALEDDERHETEEIRAPEALAPEDPPSAGPFPGGPEDTSVLKSYVDHVAYKIWHGEDRGELKMVTSGRKLQECVLHPGIQQRVETSGLAPLLSSCYPEVDKGILSAFVERLHRETNSFHLPVGEMTITLDDVSSLLHLPIMGSFWTHPGSDRDIAYALLTKLLGVSYEEAVTETERCKASKVRLLWLREKYQDHCEAQQWDMSCRAFLLHLVGCTIFADKSANSVDVAYLELFRDLPSCGNYAWGAAALTYLYDHLRHASYYKTKQLGGYTTLIQAWIFEHFPGMGSRHLTEGYVEDLPRAMRWSPARGDGRLIPYRMQLDELTTERVCWMPYGNHRVRRPFQPVSLFSGYMRWGPWIYAHLPERVLRQYEYVQGIPRTPYTVTDEPLSPDQIDQRWMNYVQYLTVTGFGAAYPGQCEEGYMEWFHRISHPYVIQPHVRDPVRVPERMSEPQPDAMPSSSINDTHPALAICDGIAELLRDMLNRRLIIEDSEGWHITQKALRLAESARKDGATSRRRRRRTEDTP